MKISVNHSNWRGPSRIYADDNDSTNVSLIIRSLSIRLETKSGRILLLAYATKYDLT